MYSVLIVDDEPFISEGLSDAVDWSAYGLEIAGCADNGEQALEMLRRMPVDLLITDISMPVMNGLELIQQARLLQPHLKVIILSGYNEFDYLKKGMQLGIENYLLKPIHFEELYATLSDTVQKLNAAKPVRVFGDNEVGILRDNVMYRWLTGRISPPELAERTALLGINLKPRYAAVAILRSTSGELDGYAEAERMIRHAASVILFRDVEEDPILIFGMDEPDSGRQAAMQLLTQLAEAHSNQAASLRISIGGTNLMSAAGISYEQARKAQAFFLLLPGQHLVDYERLPSSSAASWPADLLNWDTYAKSIVARDIASLSGRISNDFTVIRAAEGANPARAKSAAIELIIRMKMEADKLGRADPSEAYKAALDRVTEAGTLEEVQAAIEEVSAYAIEAFSGEDMSPVIKQVLRHIQEHYAEALSLKWLGEQYHIHPNYLGQLFHKQTGDTFADYINKYRISKAKELLQDSRMKVNEIAKQVGYLEIGYFYKQFKKHVGISPSEYKGLL